MTQYVTLRLTLSEAVALYTAGGLAESDETSVFGDDATGRRQIRAYGRAMVKLNAAYWRTVDNTMHAELPAHLRYLKP